MKVTSAIRSLNEVKPKMTFAAKLRNAAKVKMTPVAVTVICSHIMECSECGNSEDVFSYVTE